MKGTIFDFLKLAGEKPELAKELVDVAARHGFEFADAGELGDDDLESVVGGIDNLGGLSDEMGLKLQMQMQRRAQIIQTLSNVMTKTSDTLDTIVSNIK